MSQVKKSKIPRMPPPSSKNTKISFIPKRKTFYALHITNEKYSRKFKEKEKVIELVKQFKINKTTTRFKINIVKIIDEYPKLIKS